MKSLSDRIQRKFIGSHKANNYEVLTDSGWRDCIAVHKTVPYRIWQIVTSNHILKCADTHIVFKCGFEQIFAKDLSIGDQILTDTGLEKVEAIMQLDASDNMYDIELTDNSDHRYYTNGILSHNTTSYTVYALWLLIFHPEKRIMLLANKADTALEILGRIKMAYEYLPAWLKPGVVILNKGEIVFSNKSAIKGFATASDSARGYSANCVIMDEASFVPNNIASKVFESIYPVISSSKNSQFIMVSTPNGADPNNLYYSIWLKANQKTQDKNAEGWKPFRFDWWDVPGRDEQWKATTMASIGERRFAQEFGNEFLSNTSMMKLISDDVIEKYRIRLSEMKTQGKLEGKKQLVLSEKQDKVYEFTMWHEFDRKRTYMASADVAEGVGGDDSVLYVWDITDTSNVTMCARFSSNRVSLVEFAFICSKVLGLYGNPYLFCERNGISGGMLDSLRITYGYPSLAAESKNGEPGIYSHITVKGKSCLWTRDMLTTPGFGFTIYDKELIDEFSNFVKKDSKGVHPVYHCPRPAHDDHVMAFIWGCYALQNEIIDKYFIVCQTFTDLDVIYPKTVMPQNAYSAADIQRIQNDPLYRDFVEFKSENMAKFQKAMSAMENEDRNDIFKYSAEDMYFGDDDGPSWNTPSKAARPTSMNPNAYAPSFFII